MATLVPKDRKARWGLQESLVLGLQGLQDLKEIAGYWESLENRGLKVSL